MWEGEQFLEDTVVPRNRGCMYSMYVGREIILNFGETAAAAASSKTVT